MKKTHMGMDRKTVCGIKTKHLPRGRVVSHKPTCNRCRKMRSGRVVDFGRPSGGRWTARGWSQKAG